MLDDEIIAVNGVEVKHNVNEWFHFFDNEQKVVTVFRQGKLIEMTLPEVNRFFYNKYSVVPVKDPNNPQRQGMKAWSS